MSVARRLTAGLLANGMFQVWAILGQLITVPVLSVKWGASGYGTWLMISTVPTYVLLSSFGFGTAAVIDMTRNYALGDRGKVLAAFQSAWLFISAILATVLVLAGAVWIWRAQLAVLVPALHGSDDVVAAACLMVVYAVAILEMATVGAGFQCSGRYAQGTFLFDLAYPVEAVVVISTCLLDGRMAVVALAAVMVRIVALGAYYLLLLRYEPWMRLGWSHASFATVRRLAHPALASLSLAISGAFSLEGLMLSLGFYVSPATTAIFATTRTVAKIPLQFIRMSTKATLPEMTAAFSTNNTRLSANLVALNLGLTAAIAAPSALGLMVIGPSVVDILSHHRLKSNTLLFVGLALTAALQATWGTIGQFLFAINKQQKFAYHYLLLSALVGISPFLVGPSHTAIKSALVWCLAEAVMCLIVYRAWLSETHVTLADLAGSWSLLLARGRSTLRQLVGGAVTR